MTTKITIQVDVADAVRRGELAAGPVPVVIDSWEGWTDEELEALADVVAASRGVALRIAAAPTPEGLHAWATERVGACEAKKTARADQFASLPGLARERVELEGVGWLVGVRSVCLYGGRVAAGTAYGDQVGCPIPEDLIPLVEAEEEARRLAGIAEEEEMARVREARVAADEARRLRRGALMADLNAIFLSPEQRDRAEAGVLPPEERDEAHKNGLFATLFGGEEPPRYELIRFVELEHDSTRGCYSHGEVTSVTVSERAHLDAVSWAALKALRERVEGAVAIFGAGWSVEVVSRRHVVSCDECDALVARDDLSVTLTHPDLAGSLRRSYAL